MRPISRAWRRIAHLLAGRYFLLRAAPWPQNLWLNSSSDGTTGRGADPGPPGRRRD